MDNGFTCFYFYHACVFILRNLHHIRLCNSPGNSPGRGLTRRGTGSASGDQ